MEESPPAHPEMINTDVSNSVNSSVLRDKQVAAELSNGNNTLHGVSVEQSSRGIGDGKKEENTGTGSCLFPTKAVSYSYICKIYQLSCCWLCFLFLSGLLSEYLSFAGSRGDRSSVKEAKSCFWGIVW